MGVWEIIFIVVIVGLVLSPIYIEIKDFENQVKTFLINFFTLRNTIFLIIVLIICIYLIYRVISSIKGAYYERLNRKKEISYQYWAIRDILKDFRENKTGLEEFIQALKNKISRISGFDELKDDRKMLDLKLLEVEKDLIKQKHEQSLDHIRAEKYQEQREIEELEKKKRAIELELENDKSQILMKLDTYENRVFKKESLSKKEYQVLIENGFKQVNEFCVLEKKRIPVLVKPFGNHTISHEFLVWNVKRLIKETEGVRKIKEHLTRDADITFEFKGKEFALEIEKGELLRKHKQLKEKIDYLNKEYPKRWMIVVSNRDFFTKYKKFGFTSTRKRLSENLEKLLKKAHTKIPYV